MCGYGGQVLITTFLEGLIRLVCWPLREEVQALNLLLQVAAHPALIAGSVSQIGKVELSTTVLPRSTSSSSRRWLFSWEGLIQNFLVNGGQILYRTFLPLAQLLVFHRVPPVVTLAFVGAHWAQHLFGFLGSGSVS